MGMHFYKVAPLGTSTFCSLVRLSGRENASRVNTEFDLSKGNIFSAVNAVALGARVRNALRDLWDRVQIWFGGKKDELIPADQAARMVLRALDKGVNPDADGGRC